MLMLESPPFAMPSTTKRRTRATVRTETQKLAILRAASQVFRERGFAGAGMRDIAAAADLPTANLYHYFKGKDEILYFCQDRALARMVTSVNSARRSRANYTDQLRRVLVHHAMCIMGDVEGSVAHLETQALERDLRAKIVAKRDLYERAIRKLVSDGASVGEFYCIDPTLTTRAILGALNWTARWFRSDGRRPAGAVAEELADYLLRGLHSPKSPARSPYARS